MPPLDEKKKHSRLYLECATLPNSQWISYSPDGVSYSVALYDGESVSGWERKTKEVVTI